MLIAFGFYSFNDSENRVLLCVGTFVSLVITLILAIGTSFEFNRTKTNVRVVSYIFFALFFISNSLFTFINFSVPNYIIMNGILLLVYVLIAFSIYKAKQ